jgi:hypothetical protein
MIGTASSAATHLLAEGLEILLLLLQPFPDGVNVM